MRFGNGREQAVLPSSLDPGPIIACTCPHPALTQYNDDEDEEEGIYVAVPIRSSLRPSSMVSVEGTPSFSSTSSAASMSSYQDRRESTLLKGGKEALMLKQAAAAAAAEKGPRKVNVRSNDLERRTKRGWLYKRGGKLGNKVWKREGSNERVWLSLIFSSGFFPFLLGLGQALLGL